MAISTLSGANAGAGYTFELCKPIAATATVPIPVTWFYLAGQPGAAAAPSPGMSGAALTSYAGQVPFNNPVSGNTYLMNMRAGSNGTGTIVVADRLWHNSGIDVTNTGSQTVNSAAWPARDANGSTNGEGVFIALEVVTATGAGTPTITVGYTNSDGTAGRTGTNIVSTVASSGSGYFYYISLQDGDKGVRSVQTVQLSATWTSGTVSLVAFRPMVKLPVLARAGAVDWVTSGGVRFYDNSVPFLYYHPTATTQLLLTGSLVYTQG
jgi:hypothetical protein